MKKRKKPFFSIITVTKNSEKTLIRNLKSLNSQTCKDFEHIIIDGYSSDRTINIVKKYKKKIDFFISKKDKNMWEAINTGIKHSKGKIIGILNSDDILYPNGLKIVKKYFNSKKIDFLCASVRKKKVYHGFFPNKVNYKFNIFPSHSVGFYINKKVQNKIGLYDEKLKYCADYDLIYRLIRNGFKGHHTKKTELVGKFYPGGISERINFIEYVYYQAIVRLKNKDNFFYVMLLSIAHIFYYYIKKLFNEKNF